MLGHHFHSQGAKNGRERKRDEEREKKDHALLFKKNRQILITIHECFNVNKIILQFSQCW